MSTVLHAPCDLASAHHAANDAADHAAGDARPAASASRPNWVLATTILASSLAFIDASVVNVALPSIGRTLGAHDGALPWVVNAYLLPLSALLLLGGGLGDRFGRRRLLVAGVALFALASVLCAAAPSLAVLLAGRLLQGIGAAMLMPNSLAILGASFSGEARGRAIGIWAATGAVAGAVGPVLGGWLVDLGSWRAIFLINLPLAAIGIVLAWRFVRDEPDATRESLDFGGGILAAVGLAGLTWALTVGSGPAGASAPAMVVGAAGVLVLALFLVVEHRRESSAMMPLAMFASRSFVGLTLLTLLLYGALGVLLILIPYVLIEAAGYSGTAAGAALLPLPLVLSIVSPSMGALAGRIGPRLPLAIGATVVAAGFVLALRIGPDARYWTDVLPMILVIAAGLSGAVAPLTTAVLGSVDARHSGSASGLNSAVARTGGLIATALLGAVLAAHGARLIGVFHAAMMVGAVACLLAGISAFLLIPAKLQRPDARTT